MYIQINIVQFKREEKRASKILEKNCCPKKNAKPSYEIQKNKRKNYKITQTTTNSTASFKFIKFIIQFCK